MPACTQYEILEVTGTNTDLDGIYYKYTDNFNNEGYSAWSKPEGTVPVAPGSGIYSIAKSGNAWGIFTGAIPWYFTSVLANCPVGLTANKFFLAPPSASASALITAYTPQNNNVPENGDTFGLPAETVALITSRFGSVARFLRLRNLGQV